MIVFIKIVFLHKIDFKNHVLFQNQHKSLIFKY